MRNSLLIRTLEAKLFFKCLQSKCPPLSFSQFSVCNFELCHLLSAGQPFFNGNQHRETIPDRSFGSHAYVTDEHPYRRSGTYARLNHPMTLYWKDMDLHLNLLFDQAHVAFLMWNPLHAYELLVFLWMSNVLNGNETLCMDNALH